MGLDPRKKRVLVTGCSPGSIGEALAKELLNNDGKYADTLVDGVLC